MTPATIGIAIVLVTWAIMWRLLRDFDMKLATLELVRRVELQGILIDMQRKKIEAVREGLDNGQRDP